VETYIKASVLKEKLEAQLKSLKAKRNMTDWFAEPTEDDD
jgi:hypothetical protein